MTTVALKNGRFGIYEVDGEGDNAALGDLLYEFHNGTTNDQACRAYDRYLETGELP